MVRRLELGTNAKATEVDQIYRIFSEVGLSKRSEKRREETAFRFCSLCAALTLRPQRPAIVGNMASRTEDASGELEDISESRSNEVSDRPTTLGSTKASPTRAGHELRASIASLEFAIRREGWLYKNHHGGPYAKTHKRRWFLSDGFHVEYFEDEARTRRTGRFDLRNVVGLGASTEVTRGLDFQLSESKSGQPSPHPQLCPCPCPIPALSQPSP